MRRPYDCFSGGRLNQLVTVGEANDLIDHGRMLHVAGDEKALRQLHKGRWIGGTIPYFLTQDGGVVERERLFVTELPSIASDMTTQMLDIGHIPAIFTEAPANGFSIVIVPGMSDIHTTYSLTAASIPGLYETAVMGWIAGVHLNDIGEVTPKVFDGPTGAVSDQKIVVLRANLPLSHKAVVETINVFSQGDGDEIVFLESGFSAGPCIINGKPDDFYDYTRRNDLDLALPLITDRAEQMINVSFQLLDHETRRVHFFAPVIKKRLYRQARPMPDYRLALIAAAKEHVIDAAFSCNCILNYMHGKLEGEQFIPVTGPATFGELAPVLINQTLVTLSIRPK